MPIKVLVVDDSGFFRRRVAEILAADSAIEVIDTASNGREGVDKALKLKPDVITMDIEMPLMDGISAVRHIRASNLDVPILMFSSLTHNGARATLDALEAGASDYLPKRFEDIAQNPQQVATILRQRVKALASRRSFAPASKPAPAPSTPQAPAPSVTSRVASAASSASAVTAARTAAVARPAKTERFQPSGKRHKILLIGSSTGGPVALQTVLSRLPANFPLPIVLVQHMPAAFTPAFAERLNALCAIKVKEAESGDVLRPGCAYLAPGGQQLLLESVSLGSTVLQVKDGGGVQLNYKPSVDITFASAARIYGGGALGVILTGMGADGRDGSRMLKQRGATIWAQDEASCVVYGMPQAVTNAGISSLSLPLNQIGEAIVLECQHG
ncbi:MAG: chemotaxis response regulator protein-glutamate methylesterase [Ferrimonas sp.]